MFSVSVHSDATSGELRIAGYHSKSCGGLTWVTIESGDERLSIFFNTTYELFEFAEAVKAAADQAVCMAIEAEKEEMS